MSQRNGLGRQAVHRELIKALYVLAGMVSRQGTDGGGRGSSSAPLADVLLKSPHPSQPRALACETCRQTPTLPLRSHFSHLVFTALMRPRSPCPHVPRLQLPGSGDWQRVRGRSFGSRSSALPPTWPLSLVSGGGLVRRAVLPLPASAQ